MDRHSRVLDKRRGRTVAPLNGLKPKSMVGLAANAVGCGMVDAPVRPRYERKQVEVNCVHCGESYYRAYFEGRGWLCNKCGLVDEAMKHVQPYERGQ